MSYQQMHGIAWIKQIMGWVIFILALLSTVISGLNFLSQFNEEQKGINAIIFDFIRVITAIFREHTGLLDFFWYNAPVPVLGQGVTLSNLFFGIIYWLVFVGMALTASAARIKRQLRHVSEGIEDQLILEKIKGETGHSRRELEQKITFPSHTILSQVFSLYILPVIIGIIGYFMLNLLNIM